MGVGEALTGMRDRATTTDSALERDIAPEAGGRGRCSPTNFKYQNSVSLLTI
jgi:hypothetical protein